MSLFVGAGTAPDMFDCAQYDKKGHINHVARGIHFRASGPNLRKLSPQQVKRAQFITVGLNRIAHARAAPLNNGKLVYVLQ